ncbi:MAG TPA: NADH-quinone oxidoreductase subunit L [Opitutaceae bacterium]|nr:NADH-quinone oxidoreductase subunit L [Opitutaceae bacterium]
MAIIDFIAGVLGNNYWLIPAMPLLAAAVGALTPRRGRRLAATAAIAGMIGAFALSCLALLSALITLNAHEYNNFDWFELGNTAVRLGFVNDPLTGFMCVMVTFVSLLIFIFSLGYMKDDANFTRFFCFLSLFAAAMLGILVSNSLLVLFMCWELVGLASYLLIGFWFHKPEAAAAAKKAFIVTRIGDLGFLLGILWLYHATGSLLFYDGGSGVLETAALEGLAAQTTMGGLAVSTAIGLLIFCGAAGKSGQFPLHVWLPDAMEGPTPVSALIHAATMVAAGVFLIARVYPLMTADQTLANVPVHALTVVAFVGAITALLGALIAVAQNDLKRVLAFSTVSQLGYMMLALGVGSWVAAIFHLLTHAFFKALLFLGAGSVIHAAHHEQDMRKLGGLSKPMRVTFATFAIGMMALAGVPFLFSGFWSKEAILHAAHVWDVSHLPLYAGLAAVVLTAFYMTRLVAETFFGKPRSTAAEHAHENSAVMTTPLVLLAFAAIAVGFLGTPAWPWLQSALTNTPVESHSLFAGGGLMMLSILLVALGLGAGWAIYGRRARVSVAARDPLASAVPGVFAFLGARMKFDELYSATLGRLNAFLAALADFFDRWVWGGAVNVLATLGELAGTMNREADEDALNGGFDATSERFRSAGKSYSRAQTGDAHGYLRTVVLGFVVLALLVILGGAR